MSLRDEALCEFDRNEAYFAERTSRDIEKYRKGTIRLDVTDAEGKPIPGVKIRAEQKTHDFRFGANLFMLDELESEEKNRRYREIFADTFNMATLPFYWDDQEPERGKPRYAADSPKIYRRPPVDLCLNFCREHGIEPREHALSYAKFFPKWTDGMTLPELRRAYEAHCAELAERYADTIRTIEVTNEHFTTSMHQRQDSIGRFYQAPDFIDNSFRTARKYFPHNQLVINESIGEVFDDARMQFSSRYFLLVQSALLRGVPIDAIGMQYHLFYRREAFVEKSRYTLDPMNLFRCFDTLGSLHLPMQVTELTFPAFSDRPEDEAMQAEILEKLYTLFFSIPQMEQIVYWNLPDGYAAWAPLGDMTKGENYYYGGLIRHDFTEKPALETLRRLTKKTWHTSAQTETGRAGTAALTGFYGEYALTLEHDGKITEKTVHLSKDAYPNVKIEL